MKRYLLDTTSLAAYLHNRPGVVTLLTPLLTSHEVATSSLVYAEVAEYIQGLPSPKKRLQELRHLLQEIYPHFLTYAILDRYAAIRRSLRPPYGPGLIGDIDTLIAATAIERNLTLLTVDQDFAQVPNLRVRYLNLKAGT